MKRNEQMTRRTLLRAGGTGLAMTLGGLARPAAGAALAGVSAAGLRAPANQSTAGFSDTLALAERYRGDLTDLLSSLVSIRSHSGESAEAAQEVVADYLSQLSYRVESSRDVPSRLADHIEFMPPSPPGDGPFVNIIGHPQDARATPT